MNLDSPTELLPTAQWLCGDSRRRHRYSEQPKPAVPLGAGTSSVSWGPRISSNGSQSIDKAIACFPKLISCWRRQSRCYPVDVTRWASPCDLRSKELLNPFRLWPARNERPPGILEYNNSPALTVWGRRKELRRSKTGRRRNAGGERKNLQAKKTALTLLDKCYQ